MTVEPREGIRDLAPYLSPQPDVAARLNTNESPHPLPPGYFDELAAVIRDLPLNRYPDGQMTRLREELAALHRHTMAGTWVANGSNEILTQLVQAYGGPGRRAMTFEPTYLLHARLCALTSTTVERRTLPGDFALTEAQVAEAVATMPEVVFVCSPNNPTGTAQPIEIVAGMADALPSSLVIVDEAYAEFSDGPSALSLLASHDNVAVVRTFSKAFAMAGARIGYVLTSPGVVEDLQRVRLPYNVSALTQAAGIAALRHRSEALALVAAIRTQRERIAARLGAIEGLTAFPSDANFVLFVPPCDAAALWTRLLSRGVLIRDMTAVVPNALRVTAGSEHETDLFLKVLTEEIAP
jgi:histidinol-phosphate aminotransferase